MHTRINVSSCPRAFRSQYLTRSLLGTGPEGHVGDQVLRMDLLLLYVSLHKTIKYSDGSGYLD